MNGRKLKAGFYLTCALLLVFFSGCKRENKSSAKSIPSRIVCLSPSSAEIIWAVGAGHKIVARTDFCDYPPQVLELPSVGGFDGKTLSLERILSFDPDLVYGAKGMHDFIAEPLGSLGIRTYLAESSSVENVLEEIEFMAELTGNKKKGTDCIAEIRKEMPDITELKTKFGVYYEVWYAPFMTAGKSSYINSIIEKAGGRNIFEQLEDPYPMVSEESIILANPEIILIPRQNGVSLESVYERKGWQNIDAVKNQRVYYVDSDLISRPGPRIGKAVKEIRELYGNVGK